MFFVWVKKGGSILHSLNQRGNSVIGKTDSQGSYRGQGETGEKGCVDTCFARDGTNLSPGFHTLRIFLCSLGLLVAGQEEGTWVVGGGRTSGYLARPWAYVGCRMMWFQLVWNDAWCGSILYNKSAPFSDVESDLFASLIYKNRESENFNAEKLLKGQPQSFYWLGKWVPRGQVTWQGHRTRKGQIALIL